MTIQFNEDMHPDVLIRIGQAVAQNMADLAKAHGSGSINAVAWHSRNLLELAMWSEHCAKNEENARQFVLDAARDACDALNIPDEIVFAASVKDTRQELIDKAQSDGFDIEEKYTAVSKVAKQLGHSDIFRTLNKLLSKFAHPTAMLILYNPTDSSLVSLRGKFFALGLHLGQKALTFLPKDARVS